MRDISVDYLTEMLRAYSKEDIISALIKLDFLTAYRIARSCKHQKIMRQAEEDKIRIEDDFKKLNEYKVLLAELRQVGIKNFPLEKLEKMQTLLKEIGKV